MDQLVLNVVPNAKPVSHHRPTVPAASQATISTATPAPSVILTVPHAMPVLVHACHAI